MNDYSIIDPDKQKVWRVELQLFFTHYFVISNMYLAAQKNLLNERGQLSTHNICDSRSVQGFQMLQFEILGT